MVDELERWIKTVFKVSILNDWINEIDNNRDGGIERKECEWRGWVASEVRESQDDMKLCCDMKISRREWTTMPVVSIFYCKLRRALKEGFGV